MTSENSKHYPIRTTCCPCGCGERHSTGGVTRRGFLQGISGAVAIGTALSGLTWSAVSAADHGDRAGPQRRALVVRPILTYETPTPRPQTSWRNWGGIQTQQQAEEELVRIQKELDQIKKRADFPLEIVTPVGIRNAQDLAKITDFAQADVCIIYAAGAGMNLFDEIAKQAKNTIIFCRHKSGPVYLWYEIISPRYLRQHTDTLKVKGKACFSCIIPCSRYVRIDEKGKTILASEGPEFEGLAAFTSKVGNPPVCSTFTSAAPLMDCNTEAIRPADPVIASRSSP